MPPEELIQSEILSCPKKYKKRQRLIKIGIGGSGKKRLEGTKYI
jgi:hypothetical protein